MSCVPKNTATKLRIFFVLSSINLKKCQILCNFSRKVFYTGRFCVVRLKVVIPTCSNSTSRISKNVVGADILGILRRMAAEISLLFFSNQLHPYSFGDRKPIGRCLYEKNPRNLLRFRGKNLALLSLMRSLEIL